MADRFDDPAFWATGPIGGHGPWKFIFEEDGKCRIIALAKDGRWFEWHKHGFVEYMDEFAAWVREVREAHDKDI